MSAVNMIISNLESLSALERNYVLGHFQTSVQVVEAKTVEAVVVSEDKKEKKGPRGGGPTAHGDYTKKVLEENKDQLAAYKAANPDKKGAHLSFVGEYKKTHADEWNTFKADWETKHPKVEKASEPEVVVQVATSDSDDLSKMTCQQLRDVYHALLTPPKPAGLANSGKLSTKELLVKAITDLRAGVVAVKAPRPPMTEEHKAKLKAGREKKAAEKKAAEGTAPPMRSVSPSSSVGSKVKSD